METVNKLFPNRPIEPWENTENNGDIPLFTMEEIRTAAQKLKPNKAPGPDNIPVEIIKELVTQYGEVVMDIMNRALINSEFPVEWKEARLVLLEKPRKEGQDKAAYRPLCLLNALGKLLEYLVQGRFTKELEEKGGLAERQYGFRKGRSTIDAIKEVKKTAREARNRDRRIYTVMITLDVENAFNTASWNEIIKIMMKRGFSIYLVNMVRSYLTDRYIKIEGGNRVKITCGVPQGSVLGPHLWNMYYNGVLNMKVQEGVHLIGYADDLAIIISDRSETMIREKANHTLEKIGRWMEKKSLRLAPQKTEMVILDGRRTLTSMVIQIQGVEIRSSEAIKYLGVYLDRNMRMTEHVKNVARKAEMTVMGLVRLMPNIGGPRMGKRKMLNSVVHSILLYGAPVWGEVLKLNKYRDILQKIQRKMGMRICSAYRTVSTAALQVIAGILPIELLVEERTFVYERGRDSKNETRNEMVNKWQAKWEGNEVTGQWTKRLIPNIREWVERKHGETDYFLTQALTGHGSFGTYLKRIGKRQNEECESCGNVDTPEHTLFVCPRWERERMQLREEIRVEISVENIIEIMLQGERKWNSIRDYIRRILKKKGEEEFER